MQGNGRVRRRGARRASARVPACPVILSSHACSIGRAGMRAAPPPSARPGAASAPRTRTRSRGARSDRRSVRAEPLEAKLERLLDLHNFLSTNYYRAERVDPTTELENVRASASASAARRRRDGSAALRSTRAAASVLFEGAQGAMLDIDLGTYPYVTSSNTTVGGAAAGTGVGPARSTTCSASSRRTRRASARARSRRSSSDDSADTSARSATSSARRPGDRAAAAGSTPCLLKRRIFTNSLAGLCLTKLDMLDGPPESRSASAIGWTEGPRHPPLLIDRFGDCEPVYESVPGWSTPTAGATSYSRAAKEAQAYLRRIEALAGVPIDIVSTGPSRDAVIMRRHPFD